MPRPIDSVEGKPFELLHKNVVRAIKKLPTANDRPKAWRDKFTLALHRLQSLLVEDEQRLLAEANDVVDAPSTPRMAVKVRARGSEAQSP